MIAAAKEIKKTNKYSNLAILALKWQIQTVAIYASYLYIHCFQFRLWLKALIVINKMAILWIIISLVNLENLLIIHLIKVKLYLKVDIASVFIYKIAIISPVAIAKFFHIIYKAVLLFLFISRSCNRSLLRLILTYIDIIKINGCSILYLHYLVWLKEISHLLILHTKIQSNKDFYIRLLTFLEYIIKCSANNNVSFNTLHHACSDMHKVNTIKNFMTQLKKNNKVVAKKV